MPDYEKMYHSLFNDVTDTITKLQQAQQKTEEMYMNSKETVLTIFQSNTTEKKPDDPLVMTSTTTKKKAPSHDER